ncbi:MAG TPA: class I SAM-dependent methyltransferase [Streptosporangiaceae bacterium]|nr:class I SAM-dependent methyltransferase [Streptosporangiaceae bacterium]
MTTAVWAAEDYRVNRPAIPPQVAQIAVGMVARRRLAVDVGCGTGQMALAIAPYFARVMGVDADRRMIKEADLAAALAGSKNTVFTVSSAPELTGVPARCDLVTFSRSFHWMDRAATLAKVRQILDPAGSVAIVGDGSLWNGTAPWQISLKTLLQKHLGEERRVAGGGVYRHPKTSHEEELSRSGFTLVARERFEHERSWTVARVLGYLRSTSYGNPALFEDYSSFRRDAEQLLAAKPELKERAAFNILVAQKAGI